MPKTYALIFLMFLPSLAFASIVGGLLDYGLFETYWIAITSFSFSEPWSYIIILALYYPLIPLLIFVLRRTRSIFDETVA